MVTLSYAAGCLGIISTVIIYQQKTRVGLLVSKLISDVIWFAQYALISAWSGAAISIIAIIRELIFINRDKKWAKSPLWLLLFLILSGVSGVVTWKNIYSIFPCIASALAVIGFWIGKPKLSRFISYPISGCMLTYAISNAAFMAILNELLSIGSSVVGNIRHDFKKKPSEENSESEISKETNTEVI
jgi:hypothetical protein